MTNVLILLNDKNLDNYLPEIYDWSLCEAYKEYHTCRPIKKISSYEKYKENIVYGFNKGSLLFVLTQDGSSRPMGKIDLFDYNSRNHSAEFGYYLPLEFRNQGYGSILIQLFLERIFQQENLKLNKLYATVASCNEPSIKLLEKFQFRCDGVCREHYWFSDGSICDQLHYSLLEKEYLGS